MTIQIPQGAKTMQLFDMNIHIPEGKTYIDIDDNFLQNKYNQFMQNNQKQSNFNSQEELALDGKPMSMYQAPQVSQNEPQEQGVWNKINKGLEDFNNLIDPKRMISEGLDYLSPRVTSGEEGARQKIEDATNQVSGGLLPRIFTSPSNEEQKQIFQIAHDEIKKLGYQPFLEINNGDYKYIGVDKNGKEVDFTPSFRNTLASAKNELAFSVAGGYAGSLAKTAGQTIAKKALNYFVPSAIGAGSGAVSDLHSQSQNTGIEASYMDYVKRFGSAAAEDALAGAVVGTAIKGIGKTYKSVGDLISSVKTGSQIGKDMIDGMAVKADHLKENVGDKLRKISPNVLNDLASQGSEVSKAYARELIQSTNADYNNILANARTIPLEVNQGNALIDGVASKIKDFSNTAKNGFVKNASDNIANSLNNLSKNIGSKQAALNQQDLVNLSFVNDDLANLARGILANDPKMANKVANALHLQDEALLKELNLNHTSKADELYALRDVRAKRAYDEFAKGLEELDKLSPNGITIDKQALADTIDNSGVYVEITPTKIKEFIKEAMSGALDGKSVKEIYNRIDTIGKKLKDNSSYNYSGFLKNLKDVFLESIVKSSNNKELSRNILQKIRSDYADFKAYDKSKLGQKLKGSEKDISKDIDKILNETHKKKNYEGITKGLNDDEIKVLDNQIITRALEKNQINIADANHPKLVINYKALMDTLQNFKPKSKAGQEQMQILKSISNMRTSFETIIDGILNSKAKELGHGISTDFMARAKTMLVNNFTDYIAFYFMRLFDISKRAGTRIQMRRGFSNINDLKDFNKSAKEFISSIKDKTLKEEAQKATKEFNAKVKDLIKGEGFFMDKANPKYAKSDLNVKIHLNDDVKKNLNIDVNELKANLHRLQEKHPEMFKNNASVARIIKTINDNPNRYYKNDRIDISLIAKDLKNGKLAKMGIVNQGENAGKIIHLNISSNKEKEIKRLQNRNKKYLGVGSTTPTLRSTDINQGGTSNGANALSLNISNDKQKELSKSLKNENNINPYLKHYQDFVDKKERNKAFLKHSFSDFLDFKKIEKSLEKYKQNNPKKIDFKTLKKGYILDDLLNVDEDIVYAVVNKQDLKPSLTRSLSQFRNTHSNSTISNIKNSFNAREHFKESSNFDGIPTITENGLVVAGNHRTTAIKDLQGENLESYIKEAKKIYGDDVFKGFDEKNAMIVRVLNKNDDDTIIRLSKLSNDGRLSDESEKLEALGAKYKFKLHHIDNAKINSEKELMHFLGSRDVLESRRALLDHLMPDVSKALLQWERRSGGDTEFSKILSDNALNFLHLKQALNKNKIFKDNGKDFCALFKRAIESMNQSKVYKNSNELYDMLKKYAEPSLDLGSEFNLTNKDLQADILGFIIKYNDTLTNPSEALGLKIKKAIDFIYDNHSFSLFGEIKLSNYDVLNQMLNSNITSSVKYQEMLSKAIKNLSKD